MDLLLVSTNRADWGLMQPLWRLLQHHPDFATSWLITGELAKDAHKNPQAWCQIPHVCAPLQLTGDDEHSLCLGMAQELQQVSQLLVKQKPHLIIVLGDRYELLPLASAALMHKIPLAHIHGGESTQGVIDEAIRHSLSKMSALHFVAHERYRRRVIQLGEDPQRVWHVGAMGVDNFLQVPRLSRQALQDRTGVDFSQRVILLTYHPVTLDAYASAAEQAQQIIQALLGREEQVLMTQPNPDTGGLQILQAFRQAAAVHPQRFHLVDSLGTAGYAAAMEYGAVMLGNSSSGILEAASFQLPVVNIGDRQGGRIAPANVIHCPCDAQAIDQALQQALSPEFRTALQGLISPYGDGHAAERMVQVLESLDFSQAQAWLKKPFYDIDFALENPCAS